MSFSESRQDQDDSQSELQAHAQAVEYVSCKIKRTSFDNYILFLLKTASVGCCLGLLQLFDLSSSYIGVLLLPFFLQEVGHDIYVFRKSGRRIMPIEYYRITFRLIHTAAWTICAYLYFTALRREHAISQFKTIGTLAPLGVASLDLLVDFFLVRLVTVARVVALLTKLWRIVLCITLFILASASTFVSSQDELKVNTEKATYFFWFFTMQAIVITFTIYFIGKRIETACRLKRIETPQLEFINRASTVIMLNWLVMYCGVITMYAVCMNGVFYPRSIIKGIAMCVWSLIVSLYVMLLFRWRKDVSGLLDLPLADLNTVYSGCFSKKLNNRVIPISRQPNRQPAPEQEATSNIEPDKIPREESLRSIHFIERKSSVMFNRIDEKDIQRLLEDDNMMVKTVLLRKRAKSLQNVRDDNMASIEIVNDERPQSSSGVKHANIYVNKTNGNCLQKEELYGIMRQAVELNENGYKYDKIDDDVDQGKCLICQVNESNCIIYPCYHSKVCKECSMNMLNWQYSKCHFCRGILERILVIDHTHNYKGIYKVTEMYSVNYS